MGWVSHSKCVLHLMMTYHVKTPEMDVFILNDEVGKPFSVRPAADDDLLNSYGFSWPALKLVYDYFSHEKREQE